MRSTSALFVALLAACSGGSKHPVTTTTTTTTTTTPVVDAGAATPAPDPALAARTAYADPGGMWLPSQMDLPQHAAAFRSMGVALDPKTLTDPLSSPLGAIVKISGCTASFVSPDGLIVTNHHCVQDALQRNSTPTDNLVENGFLAKTRADEKSAGPAETVDIEQAFRDVTKDMVDGLDQITDATQRELELEKREKTLVAACEKGRPEVRCEVASYFRASQWELIEYLELKDLRLVYVPSRSVGDYGGEVDNWHWPRHTGDWSFYRAYVGKDGKPAAFAADNVPYHPAHFLKIATTPLREHDFVMVAGYPGSTDRLHTYSEIANDVEVEYPYEIDFLQKFYDLMTSLEQKGGATALKAGVFKQEIQNALANLQGKLAALQGGDLLTRKKDVDAQIKAWAAQPGHEDIAAKIAKLEDLIAEDRKHIQSDFDLGAASQSALLGNALLFVEMAEERPKADADRKPGFQARDLPDLEAEQLGFAMQYDPTLDRAGFALGLERALALPADQRPWLAVLVGAKKGATITQAMIDKALDKLYAGTKLTDLATRKKLLESATTAQLKKSKDSFIRLAVALRPFYKALEDRERRDNGDRILYAPAYATAMREALGGYLSPDANRTLRITYGTVKPLNPGDPAFTKLSEIPAKDTGKDPFNAPKKELDAIAAKQWGPYADPTLGEVPVDFLTDVDITGGNSGSPTLDSHGDLVGLAFDGNLASVASDEVFDGAITRTIHVDFRYALWVMDAIDGAHNVLEELGVKPAM